VVSFSRRDAAVTFSVLEYIYRKVPPFMQEMHPIEQDAFGIGRKDAP
jgi:hypothetical protein